MLFSGRVPTLDDRRHFSFYTFFFTGFCALSVSLRFLDDVAAVLCLHDYVSVAVSSLLGAAAVLDDFCGASSIPACGSPAHCNVLHL